MTDRLSCFTSEERLILQEIIDDWMDWINNDEGAFGGVDLLPFAFQTYKLSEEWIKKLNNYNYLRYYAPKE